MLHAMRFKVAQEEKFPGMTVTILTRERKVEFLGKKKSDIEAAMVDMYDIVEKMKHSSLEMSAHLIRLMRGITMITHVVKVFKRKELCAVYVAAGDTKLEVFAPSDKDLHEAIKVIKDETREECVDAGSTDVLQTPELKEKLQSYDKGLLTITESDGRVTLSGMVDLVARAKLDILQLAEIKGSHSGRSTGSSYMLGNATVEVVQGDLTTFHTDAIVNAANGQLNHKGGLAKAIVDAGGSEIQRECDDYMRQRSYRNLNPGQVYVSTSGQLPCKKVIHAVGPIWQGGYCNEEKNLYDAVYESLVAADQHRLSSVALPALSSGNSGFPIDRYTMCITTALRDFLDHKQTCVKKVVLVDKTDYVLKEFRKSLGIMSEDTSTAENKWDGKTIKVCGLQPATSDHVIKSFFQNKNQSSGGYIKTFDFDRNNGVAYVTFLTAGDAQAVLNKPGLNLNGATLKVSRAWEKSHRQDESRRCYGSRIQDESRRQDAQRSNM